VILNGEYMEKLDPKTPLHLYLSIFGLTGMTAYFGTVCILEVTKGEVFVVNAASGACGGVAGRIAKLRGAYVIGITGDDQKCDHIQKKHEFDEVINYKNYPNFEEFYEILKEKCPNGIDKYFDNVGGYQTDAVIKLMKKQGRIAICGQISYYDAELHYPNFTLAETISKAIRIEGFVVPDLFGKPEYENYLKEMNEWVKNEQCKLSIS
jgi:NADPH-dependent curcumin reductase CurA